MRINQKIAGLVKIHDSINNTDDYEVFMLLESADVRNDADEFKELMAINSATFSTMHESLIAYYLRLEGPQLSIENNRNTYDRLKRVETFQRIERPSLEDCMILDNNQVIPLRNVKIEYSAVDMSVNVVIHTNCNRDQSYELIKNIMAVG